MEYKVIEGGGITSPKGFTAGAVYVGVKSRKTQKPDVAVLYSETEASCAAVFTTNKFCAAPVILDREILKNGKARAIVINSGNANAATGTQGIEDARTVEREAEKLLGVGENEVFVCSTGVIGQKLPVEKVLDGVRQIIPAKLDKANGSDAAYAIMTTDTVRKESAYELELSSGTIRIGDTVDLGYVDQSRDELNPDKNVWEEISDGLDMITLGKKEFPSRAYVGQFNFKGGDQQKKVGQLSGGERNRVHLAKMLRKGANVILLDEPTNDLDVDTLRSLEEGIMNYPGCVLVTSHDRWFLDRLATHILAYEGNGHVEWFEGNFEEYEKDKIRRLGEDACNPHAMKYKPLER